MSVIAPSLLSADFMRLDREIQRFSDCGAKVLHLDIMDGQFVPNMTFGWSLISKFRPLLPDVKFDVHLMVQHPLAMIDHFCDAGADMVTVHVESLDPVEECLDAIERRGVTAGVSIKPGTPVEALSPFIHRLGLVLVMTVEPGFGGQSLIPHCVEKLPLVRAMAEKAGNSGLIISADGGINAENCASTAAAGADLLVAGNAVFAQEDMASAFRRLSDAVERY